MSEGFKFVGSEQSNATNYTVINGNNASLNSEYGHVYLTPTSIEIQGSDASASKVFANGSFITVGETDSDSQANGIYSKLEQNKIVLNNVNAGNGYRYTLTTDGGYLIASFYNVQNNSVSSRYFTPFMVSKDYGFLGDHTISWDNTRPNISFMSGKITLNNSQDRPTISFNDGLYTCLYYDGSGTDKDFAMNNGTSNILLKSLDTSKSKILIQAGNTGITINEATNSITSTSNITTASDINIKDIISEDTCFTVDNIADAPFFDYTYKNDESKNVQIGTSAQYWQTVCPNSVKANEDGILGLNYQGVALGSAICLAKKIKEQQSEIDELKSQIAELKTLINSK